MGRLLCTFKANGAAQYSTPGGPWKKKNDAEAARIAAEEEEKRKKERMEPNLDTRLVRATTSRLTH